MMSSSFGVNYYQKLITGFFLLVSLLVLTACGGGVIGDDKNYIVVKDQSVIYLDEIVIESVAADQDLLIVIYDESSVLPNTKSTDALGYTAVSAGDYQDVVVKLDKKITNNETLYAELRIDQGEIGRFEQTDPLVVKRVSSVSFGVVKSTDPYLAVWVGGANPTTVTSAKTSAKTSVTNKPQGNSSAGYLSSSSRIDVKKVIAQEEAWLVVFRVNADLSESVIGLGRVDAGHHSDFSIALNGAFTLSSEDQIKVGLYRVNDPDSNNFDADFDVQVTFNNEPVQVDFVVQ